MPEVRNLVTSTRGVISASFVVHSEDVARGACVTAVSGCSVVQSSVVEGEFAVSHRGWANTKLGVEKHGAGTIDHCHGARPRDGLSRRGPAPRFTV
jgi:hypothetical protein